MVSFRRVVFMNEPVRKRTVHARAIYKQFPETGAQLFLNGVTPLSSLSAWTPFASAVASKWC